MVDISKYYESNYVSVDYLKTLGEEDKKATIIGVGEEQKTKFDLAWKIPVQFNISKDIKDVTLFRNSYEQLKNGFGSSDTSRWLGKQILLTIGLSAKNTELVVVKPLNI